MRRCRRDHEGFPSSLAEEPIISFGILSSGRKLVRRFRAFLRASVDKARVASARQLYLGSAGCDVPRGVVTGAAVNIRTSFSLALILSEQVTV